MKKTRYIILILILVISLLMSYYMGRFTQWFDSNMCYSNILNLIKNEFNISNNEEEDIRLNEILNQIDTRGYETECEEIEIKLEEYTE